MKPSSLRLTGAVFALAATASLLASCATTGSDASAVLARSAQAMGATQLNTLRYTTEGNGYTFGQAYRPGGAWPKITIHSITRSIDYGSATMRDEIVLSRAEPLGGGGYPLSGQQRNDQFISGDLAWNQAGTTATPGPRFVTDRLHQLWITPHGVLKAAMRGGARATAGEAGGSNVAFNCPGRFTAVAVISADGLVRRVESAFADPVMGDTPVVTTYDDYKSTGGIQFPTRVRQTAGGHPVLAVDARGHGEVGVRRVALDQPWTQPAVVREVAVVLRQALVDNEQRRGVSSRKRAAEIVVGDVQEDHRSAGHADRRPHAHEPRALGHARLAAVRQVGLVLSRSGYIVQIAVPAQVDVVIHQRS